MQEFSQFFGPNSYLKIIFLSVVVSVSHAISQACHDQRCVVRCRLGSVIVARLPDCVTPFRPNKFYRMLMKLLFMWPSIVLCTLIDMINWRCAQNFTYYDM